MYHILKNASVLFRFSAEVQGYRFEDVRKQCFEKVCSFRFDEVQAYHFEDV